jgi:UDP-sugar pyrophosphorylase
VDQAKQILADSEQQALLDNFNGRDAAGQQAFAEEIVQLDKVTPTGMKAYCERARRLLEDSRNNVNPFDKYKPEVPGGVYLRPGEEEFDSMEEAGLQELSKLCLVLIAGGLGERLGFSGIKVSLPVSTIEDDYIYLKFYAEYALACEAKAR